MNQPSPYRLFFVHIMKTGGATMRQHLYKNFEHGEVYPVPRQDDMDRAWLVDYLLGLSAQRRDLIRVYAGHFPFIVTELMDMDFRTFSVIRDPVERTVSYLKHCKRYHARHQGWDLEAIYDDRFYFDCFVHNHQSKIYSMSPDDRLESYMDVVEVDDRRLEIATTNLEKIDVLGLSERYPEFVADLENRFGLRFGRVANRRVSREPWDAPPTLRRRIAEDNAADVAFYDFAKQLYERRRLLAAEK